MVTLTEAFFRKVDKNGPEAACGGRCWVWLGHKDRGGYGDFSYPLDGKRRHKMAHRVSWILANRRQIGRGLEIAHKCDNPPCVNPDHLFETTHSGNELDKVAKGRNVSPFFRRGEQSLQAKITDAQAVEIRFRAKDPSVRLEDLAAEFSLSVSAIVCLLNGKTFTHLPMVEVPRRTNKNCPRQGELLTCPRCRVDKSGREFSPSVYARGSGWCRDCATQYRRNRTTGHENTLVLIGNR